MAQDQTPLKPRAGVLEAGEPPYPQDTPPLLPEQVLGAVYGLSRGEGAIVAIGSRRPGLHGEAAYPRYLTALSVANWQPYLPALIEYGDLRQETIYWCPNPLRPGALKSRQTPEAMTDRLLAGVGPQYLAVKNDHVFELGALVLDLDVGRPGSTLTAAEAIGLSVIRALDGRLAPPSLFAYSGTGAYLFYLLSAPDGYLPLATPETVAVYKGCQQVLLRLTADLKADRKATRLAQWFKLPGTTDTKTGNPVVYLPFLTAGDRDLRRYDLASLASRLGIEPPEDRRRDLPPGPVGRLSPPPVARPPVQASGEPGAPRVRVRRVKPGKGAEMYRGRFRELEALWTHRGGIREGTRHTFLRVLWVVRYTDAYMHAAGSPTERRSLAYAETMAVVRRVNETQCRPPLPAAELVRVASPGKGQYSAQRIIDVLDITQAERQELGFTHLLTATERQERHRKEREGVETRHQERAAKQAAIDADLTRGLGVKATARKHHADPGNTSRRLAALRRLGQAQTPSLFNRADAPDQRGGVV